MVWTTPKTWSSEPLTSLDLNTYVRDNQNHLKDRLDASASRIVSGTSAISTTSTDFVDVDALNLSLTLTTHGGDVLLGFTGSIKNRVNSGGANLNVSVDGTDYIADDGILSYQSAGGDGAIRNAPMSFVMLIAGLKAGNHTFRLRWKTSRGNTSSMDVVRLHPQFWAKEI